jgi:5-methylcytosine-specific restriction endonuclease McrBC GTP-binding regulatory subunit McrB
MTWGFTDLYSWIPSYSNNLSGYALLFDNLFRPKPAYTSILNELYTESLKSGVSDVQNDAKIKIKKLDNKIIITSENTISNFQLFDLQGKLLFVSNFRNNQVEIPLDRNFGNLVIANIQFENGEIVSCKVLTKN